MGRDQIRVLACAAGAVALIVAGSLVMDWYRIAVTAAPVAASVGIDLRNVNICHAHGCVSTSVSMLPGMFPTLASLTLWSSIGLAVVVAFQAAARTLTGAAQDSFSKIGYMVAMGAMALTVSTAYLFGPDDHGPVDALAAQVGELLPRTWGPLTLLVGQLLGFAALYLAVHAEANDAAAAYVPVSVPALPRTRTSTGMPPLEGSGTSVGRPRSGTIPLPLATARARRETGTMDAAMAPTLATGSAPDLRDRLRSPTLPVMPGHLKNRLQYLAVTAELTAGGIDARREDGSARLVLWRDVVGVVVRRAPPDFDGTTFIDIVSTAGSTLRIAPWTRLTGDPIAGAGDARPRGILDRVVAHCPAAMLDPATKQFLETGEAAQLPDLQTMTAHDERLA